MQFKFKIQEFQTEAVNSVVNVFSNQPHSTNEYLIDQGKVQTDQQELNLDTIGYSNNSLTDTTKAELLNNIKRQQNLWNIPESKTLNEDLGNCSLDIEMETGTGKTYVYTKTMFELNKHYGWTKFIIIVPSIAIREGVYKSFELTQSHFMEQYGKKLRYFIYDSSNLQKIESYSNDSGINVIIINTQAFARDFKEGAKNKNSLIIYSKRDDFASRRPIDVIAANNPILILDEPQKMGLDNKKSTTKNALKNFNPLFSLFYSATHKKHHNLVFALDAVDAFNQKLVKKISVKGFEIKNLKGSNGYVYLDNIILSKESLKAKLEIEVRRSSGIKRELRIVTVGTNLFHLSQELEQYKDGFIVRDIDEKRDSISFVNNIELIIGDVYGTNTDSDLRRIQIRETINSHFEKEKQNFKLGIKTLSLFFIDEVSKYRQYDKDGHKILGEYGKIFEEEYLRAYNENITLFDDDYQKYLQGINRHYTHEGYFSIDKNKHVINSTVKRGSEFSDDISAYDLILKKKEKLLSFKEPIRFLFSHSALREGWDNPNIFQICTLKHSVSNISKRQEVGRGMRLCVDKDGNRMDYETIGDKIHEVNVLTVIASESYTSFVTDLQKEISEVLYERPKFVTNDFFKGKIITSELGKKITITSEMANDIEFYLIANGYINSKRQITKTYKKALKDKILEPLPDYIQHLDSGIQLLIQSVFDDSIFDKMIENGNKTKVPENKLNENFKKKEFQELWNTINHKYFYTVHFNSEELIQKVIQNIKENLYVTQLKYVVTTGKQKDFSTADDINKKDGFEVVKTKTDVLDSHVEIQEKYDLVGKIAQEATLTRKSICKILKNIGKIKLDMFKENPEEFITKVVRIIKEEKSTLIVEHISYNKTKDTYDSSIFTEENHSQTLDKVYKATKSITDYVFTDGLAEDSVEKKFARDLDNASEVCVYAKLPRGFKIPTPVGNYSPDWAVSFYRGKVKHIYFIAETKGTLDSMQLRKIEKSKIDCAKKLFNSISTDTLAYNEVDSYQSLLDILI